MTSSTACDQYTGVWGSPWRNTSSFLEFSYFILFPNNFQKLVLLQPVQTNSVYVQQTLNKSAQTDRTQNILRLFEGAESSIHHCLRHTARTLRDMTERFVHQYVNDFLAWTFDIISCMDDTINTETGMCLSDEAACLVARIVLVVVWRPVQSYQRQQCCRHALLSRSQSVILNRLFVFLLFTIYYSFLATTTKRWRWMGVGADQSVKSACLILRKISFQLQTLLLHTYCAVHLY